MDKVIKKRLHYHDGGYVMKKSYSNYQFRVIKIYPDKVSFMKDLVLCEEANYGYRECFHRMDLEGLMNDNTKM